MGEQSFVVRVWGQVQGVGFRYFTRERALQLGLRGHAYNLEDGSVEILIAGPEQKVQMMLGAGYLRPEVLKAWQGTKKIEQFEKAKVFGKLRTHNNTFHASSVVFLRQKSAKRGASPKT